jgi:hypothetical protein
MSVVSAPRASALRLGAEKWSFGGILSKSTREKDGAALVARRSSPLVDCLLIPVEWW